MLVVTLLSLRDEHLTNIGFFLEVSGPKNTEAPVIYHSLSLAIHHWPLNGLLYAQRVGVGSAKMEAMSVLKDFP